MKLGVAVLSLLPRPVGSNAMGVGVWLEVADLAEVMEVVRVVGAVRMMGVVGVVRVVRVGWMVRVWVRMDIAFLVCS